MAYYEQRGNKYQIRIFLYKDKEGKKRYYTETYTPIATKKPDIKKEVEKYALELENSLKNPSLVEGRKKRFAAFVEDWRNDFASDPENMTESLRDSYYSMLQNKAVSVIGHLPLCEISPADIRKIFVKMKEQGLSIGTQKRVQSAVRSVFYYAFNELRIIDSDPSREYVLKKKKTDTKKVYDVFNQEQYKKFLEAVKKGFDVKAKASKSHRGDQVIDVEAYSMHKSMSEQWNSYFSMAIYGGFRRGEMIALTWQDIDFEKKRVRICKAVATKKNPKYTGKGCGEVRDIQFVKDSPKTDAGNRSVDLPSFVMDELKAWRKSQLELMMKLGTKWEGYRGADFDKNFVFIDTTTGRMMDLGTPTHKIRDVIKMYNAEHPEEPLPMIRLHDLRHTHATDLIYRKVPIEKIAQRLGHKNIYVTLTVYAHYLENEDDNQISDLFEDERAVI